MRGFFDGAIIVSEMKRGLGIPRRVAVPARNPGLQRRLLEVKRVCLWVAPTRRAGLP